MRVLAYRERERKRRVYHLKVRGIQGRKAHKRGEWEKGLEGTKIDTKRNEQLAKKRKTNMKTERRQQKGQPIQIQRQHRSLQGALTTRRGQRRRAT